MGEGTDTLGIPIYIQRRQTGGSVLITPNEATSNESLWNPSFEVSEATRADALANDLSGLKIVEDNNFNRHVDSSSICRRTCAPLREAGHVHRKKGPHSRWTYGHSLGK